MLTQFWHYQPVFSLLEDSLETERNGNQNLNPCRLIPEYTTLTTRQQHVLQFHNSHLFNFPLKSSTKEQWDISTQRWYPNQILHQSHLFDCPLKSSTKEQRENSTQGWSPYRRHVLLQLDGGNPAWWRPWCRHRRARGRRGHRWPRGRRRSGPAGVRPQACWWFRRALSKIKLRSSPAAMVQPLLQNFINKYARIRWEPWFRGYCRRLMFKRWWVWIPAPITGWTFFTIICCKIVLFVFKRT